MNTSLALKIESSLGLEEGYFMTLQIFYDIKVLKQQLHQNNHPDISKLRKILFWDTSIESIDWQKYKTSIVKRVFERGNEEEKNEIVRFYGKDIVERILKQAN